MIVVVDYGMGNLRSVSKALESLGGSVCVTADPIKIKQCSKLVLPGVGALEFLREKSFDSVRLE